MALKKYKPTSPGRRFMSVSSFEEITKSEPEKSLTAPITKTGGRNVNGRITTRHQGGGHKRRYRIIDFKRRKDGIPAKVAAIEYDPNRSARIALLHYADGAKAYILAPARASSSSPRTTATASSGFPPARCAAWRWRAAPPSARSGTSTTRIRQAEKPVAAAGAASARPFAAPP